MEDYALVPEKEVMQLKRDVENIKKNPFAAYGGQDLVESISNLTKSINALIELFRTASQEINLEEREAETVGKKIDPMFEKIDVLLEQNKKIARGVVAVAEMLQSRPVSQPPPAMQRMEAPPQMPYPQMGQPMMQPRQQMMPQRPQMPPMSSMPSQPSSSRALPPIPPAPKKKGLFGK